LPQAFVPVSFSVPNWLSWYTGTMDEKKIQDQINHVEKTVDIIARAVAEGFEEMRDEFKKVRGEVGAGFEAANGKIDGLHRRIDSELERTMQIETRVTKLEVEVFPELAK